MIGIEVTVFRPPHLILNTPRTFTTGTRIYKKIQIMPDNIIASYKNGCYNLKITT
jgi:hypothetical protein